MEIAKSLAGLALDQDAADAIVAGGQFLLLNRNAGGSQSRGDAAVRFARIDDQGSHFLPPLQCSSGGIVPQGPAHASAGLHCLTRHQKAGCNKV